MDHTILDPNKDIDVINRTIFSRLYDIDRYERKSGLIDRFFASSPKCEWCKKRWTARFVHSTPSHYRTTTTHRRRKSGYSVCTKKHTKRIKSTREMEEKKHTQVRNEFSFY